LNEYFLIQIQYLSQYSRTHTCIHTNPYRSQPSVISGLYYSPTPAVCLHIAKKQIWVLQHQWFNTINTTQVLQTLIFLYFFTIFWEIWLKFDSNEELLIKNVCFFHFFISSKTLRIALLNVLFRHTSGSVCNRFGFVLSTGDIVRQITYLFFN